MVLEKKSYKKFSTKISMEKEKFQFFSISRLIMTQFLSPYFFKNKLQQDIYLFDFIEQTDLVIAKNCKLILEITQTMSSTLKKVHRVYKCCKVHCTESSKSKKIYY